MAKKPKAPKLNKQIVGIAGEYYVAAELSRLGFITTMTLKNTPRVDLLAVTPDGKRRLSIQVKTRKEGRNKWQLSSADEESMGDDHYYVFVNLNGEGGSPAYHVARGNDVAIACANRHKAWVAKPKRDGGKRKDTARRRFVIDVPNKDWKLLSNSR